MTFATFDPKGPHLARLLALSNLYNGFRVYLVYRANLYLYISYNLTY